LRAATSHNKQNTDAPFIGMNYCRRSISLAALNESFDSGSLNGGVLQNVISHFKTTENNDRTI
jgi:hypothetical protein